MRPSDLPVASARQSIVQMCKGNRCVVLIGQTGCGKTTQVPQYLLDGGLLGAHSDAIAVTQPRRVAAISVARRVAAERSEPLGRTVGYRVRFEDCVSPRTRITFMTDGVLLRDFLLDSQQRRYSVVIVDEAHERSLHTDVLLALLRRELEDSKSTLRVVVMSATLDASRFSEYFGGAPVAYIEGRTFPIDVQYLAQPVANYVDAAVSTALQIHVAQRDEPGDILVFLTGQEEIEGAAHMLHSRLKQLRGTSAKGERVRDTSAASHGGSDGDGAQQAAAAARPTIAPLNVVPLFGALSSELQMRVFEPSRPGERKVVLATNIAETSITVAGVRFVIDCGLCKQKRFQSKLTMDSLLVEPISKSAARQRAGRAGRDAPGTCFRLYTEDDFTLLAETTEPEIVRCSLSGVLLVLAALGVRDFVRFPFLDKPPTGILLRSMEELLEVGALTPEGDISALGRELVSFPLEPSLARLLLLAKREDCLGAMVTLIACLSVENLFATHVSSKAVGAARKRLWHVDGDHVSLLQMYSEWRATGFRQSWCAENGIDVRSAGKLRQVRQQLVDIAVRMPSFAGHSLDATELTDAQASGIVRCLVSAYPRFVAERQQGTTSEYRTLQGRQVFHMHPSSSLRERMPQFVVFTETIFTTKPYMRNASAVPHEVVQMMSSGSGAPGAPAAAPTTMPAAPALPRPDQQQNKLRPTPSPSSAAPSAKRPHPHEAGRVQVAFQRRS